MRRRTGLFQESSTRETGRWAPVTAVVLQRPPWIWVTGIDEERAERFTSEAGFYNSSQKDALRMDNTQAQAYLKSVEVAVTMKKLVSCLNTKSRD